MHRTCQCKLLLKSLSFFFPSHTHANTYRMGRSLGVWAWVSLRVPVLLLLLRLPELEFLLYGQFRRIVSSAVASARFFFCGTHLNLDFTEFNFAVRMTLPAAYLCVRVYKFLCNELNLFCASSSFVRMCVLYVCMYGSFVRCEDNLTFPLTRRQRLPSLMKYPNCFSLESISFVQTNISI